MSCRILLLLLLLVSAACRRDPQPAYRRVAVAAFENLSGDPTLDWMSLALADLAAWAVTGKADSHPVRIEHSSSAAAVRATHLLHGAFWRSSDRLHAEIALEDLRRLRIVGSATAAVPASAGPAPLADRLLAALGLHARSVASRDPEALRLYVTARTAQDPAALLRHAVVADPGCGPAWMALAQAHLARRDVSGARNTLAEALRTGALDPVDRARLSLLEAALGDEPEAYGRALRTLAGLAPADPEVFQRLATHRQAARDVQGAAAALEEALKRDPDNPVVLNEAGYAWAYADNAPAALSVLERYRRLQPSEPNPPDSLGDVHFQFGRFAEAESLYLEADSKSPGFAGGASLLKAAYARLLLGDRKGADALFARFLQARARAGDSLLEFRRAEWDYVTGRRQQAFQRLSAWAAGGRQADERVLAFTRLAVWSLDCDERAQARRYAQQAVRAGGSPQAQSATRLCLWLTEDRGSPEQWSRSAESDLGGRFPILIRESVLGYALLLWKHYREAVPLLREMGRRTPLSPGEPFPVLLAWALLESGQDPGSLLSRWPLPRVQIEQPLPGLVYPRVIFLRGWWIETQGRHDEARNLYRLFLSYAGDRASAFGERRRAEAALGP